MKKKYLIIAFIVTVLMQLSVPAMMIYDSEITEKEGTAFKFKTVPIDPTDPFRGKYITLSYDIASYPTTDTTFTNGELVYVVLAKDEAGFAKIASVSHNKPKGTDEYVAADVNFNYGGKLNLEFPFDRFYMNENKAADAETAYDEYSTKENAKPAYAVVAVKEGNAVVKDVIVDGMPIKEYVEKNKP